MSSFARRVPLLAAMLVLASCSSPSGSVIPGEPSESRAVPASPSIGPTARPTRISEPGSATWSKLRVPGGPGKREDHTWTLATNGRAYLFGGRDGATVFDDLWAYDLAADSWARLAPAGPTPPGRFGHNADWVDGIGLVIFAGQNGADFYNDLWAYDPAADTWQRLPAAGDLPVARYGSCAAVGPDGRLWISHGFTSEGTRFADTRAYDFALATWTDETPTGDLPLNRCLHACWWTTDGGFVLYGGSTTGVTALDDLWALRDGAWTEARLEMPPARNLYAAARIDPRTTLVFGGQGLDGGYLDDAWLFDDAHARPTALSADGRPPPARSAAEMVADPGRDRLLLFGGKNDSGALGDLWQLLLPTP